MDSYNFFFTFMLLAHGVGDDDRHSLNFLCTLFTKRNFDRKEDK